MGRGLVARLRWRIARLRRRQSGRSPYACSITRHRSVPRRASRQKYRPMPLILSRRCRCAVRKRQSLERRSVMNVRHCLNVTRAAQPARQQPRKLPIPGGVLLAISIFTCAAMAQTLPPGRYIITLADGGLALEAEASGMNSNDGKIHLWRNNGGGPTQVWSVGSAGEGTYTITLLATRKALDADGPTMHSDDGKVHLWDYNAGKTQKWRIQSAGPANTFSLILADGGKALDAAILSMHQNDGLVHLWSANGGKT